MKKINFRLFVVVFTAVLLLGTNTNAQNAERLFDAGWLFYRGAAQGAEAPDFPDSNWRAVDLPHDWSIEDIPGTSSPFSPGAIGQASTGFTVGGTGWYRKHFSAADFPRGKTFIQFDGVYMNADVWLNGKRLGRHPYGYTSFYFDISDRLNYEGDNVIAVRVRNEGENSRWYSGSGIYRHVWIQHTEKLHFAKWGTSVQTVKFEGNKAILRVKTKIRNDHSTAVTAQLSHKLNDKAGKTVSVALSPFRLEAGKDTILSLEMVVAGAKLWSPDSPTLYNLVSEISTSGKTSAFQQTTVGIRTIGYNSEKGFMINGKSIKLKGGCVHHDNGPLGAKAYDRAEIRKVQLLKASGFNAVRTAHNPVSPAFLAACDSLGMLVIEEAFDTWNEAKNRYDYNVFFNEWWERDVESMVTRDINHPSIVMWSSGNEIPRRERIEVATLSAKISAKIKSLDPSRPVTNGVNGAAPDKDSLFRTLDIGGYNYAWEKYEEDHLRVPDRVIYGAESFPSEAFENWNQVESKPWVIGDFVWTAFDYIGESSIGWLGFPQTQLFFPWTLAYCGDIDICGWKRPQSYYRDALWKENQLSVFVQAPKLSYDTNRNKVDWSRWEWEDVVSSWTWPGEENSPLEVKVYSSCEKVELFLNDRSLGVKETNTGTKMKASWKVPYQAGVLKAVGYRKGKVVNTAILATAGEPVKAGFMADRSIILADNQDLSYVTFELKDENGNTYPLADRLVTFEISGPGIIVATANADPRSTESFTAPQRRTHKGRGMVIVKSGYEAGNIVVKAKADGIPEATVTIKTVAAR